MFVIAASVFFCAHCSPQWKLELYFFLLLTWEFSVTFCTQFSTKKWYKQRNIRNVNLSTLGSKKALRFCCCWSSSSSWNVVLFCLICLLWPIYIYRNHRGFGTFCTKSLGVSESQNTRGFGISAVWLAVSFQKPFGISPVRSSELVCKSSWVLTISQ